MIGFILLFLYIFPFRARDSLWRAVISRSAQTEVCLSDRYDTRWCLWNLSARSKLQSDQLEKQTNKPTPESHLFNCMQGPDGCVKCLSIKAMNSKVQAKLRELRRICRQIGTCWQDKWRGKMCYVQGLVSVSPQLAISMSISISMCMSTPHRAEHPKLAQFCSRERLQGENCSFHEGFFC